MYPVVHQPVDDLSVESDAVQYNTFCFFYTHILAGISGIGEIGELVVAALD